MKFLFIAYDNDSYIHTFPLGIAYLTSVLKKAGHEVTIYQQDINHWPEEHLTEYLNENTFDVVGIGVIAGYYQYRKLLKISEVINNSSNRPKWYILGGHGPSPEPEYFLRKTGADVVMIGEAENTILEFIENINDLSKVRGIAYRREDKVFINPRMPLIDDIDSIPWPDFRSFDMNVYRLIRNPLSVNSDFHGAVLSARGCTNHCNFCYRMDAGYRARDPNAILSEVHYLQTMYGVTYVEFTDELLMASTARVNEVCEAIMKSGLKFKWYCEGRLNHASKENLALMKRAGVTFINYGIEAFDDKILKNMEKNLTTKQIEEGIKNTLKAGILPGFNVIFGNIGETKKTLIKGLNFLLKYDHCAVLRNIRPVTPYPGTKLYYHAIKKGLLKDAADFYENKHINSDLLSVNFTNMSDEEFHKSLFKANTILINNYMRKKTNELLKTAQKLYMDHDITFRGFRQT